MEFARKQLRNPVGSVLGTGGFGQVSTAHWSSTAGQDLVISTVVAKKVAYVARHDVQEREGKGPIPGVRDSEPYQPRAKRLCVADSSHLSDQLRYKIAALQQEASVLRKVGNHPNVITMLADRSRLNSSDQTPYILLPLTQGTLRDLMGYDSRHLSPRARMGLAMDICNGLAHVHRCRWVHCDVKSSNVLVEYSVVLQRYVALVSDFGIARPMPEEGSTGKVAPTFMYGDFAKCYPEYRHLEKPLNDYHRYDELHAVLKVKVLFGPHVDVYALSTVLSDIFLDGSYIETVPSAVYESVCDLIRKCQSRNPCDRPTAAFVCQSLLFHIQH